MVRELHHTVLASMSWEQKCRQLVRKSFPSAPLGATEQCKRLAKSRFHFVDSQIVDAQILQQNIWCVSLLKLHQWSRSSMVINLKGNWTASLSRLWLINPYFIMTHHARRNSSSILHQCTWLLLLNVLCEHYGMGSVWRILQSCIASHL